MDHTYSVSQIDSLVLGMALDRFAVYGSSTIIFGVMVFTVLLAPMRVADELTRRLNPLMDGTMIILVGAMLPWPILEAAQIDGTWAGAFQLPTIGTLLSSTAPGTFWIEQMMVSLLLMVIYLALGRRGRYPVLLVGAALMVSLALVGHAAMDGGWRGDLHKANDAIHILAASTWIGGLVALMPCLRMLDDPDLRRQASTALIRFSVIGHIAVALVIATGIVNAYLILGRWPIDFGSLYQLLLLGKIIAVTGMVTLALVNRYVLVPAIRCRGSSAVFALKRLTIIELGLAVAVLALVSLFGILDPQ